MRRARGEAILNRLQAVVGNKFLPELSSDPQGHQMEYRGLRFVVRATMARDKWRVGVYTGGGNAVIERTVSGSRDEAGKVVRRMIDRLLDGKLIGEAGELRD